MKNVIVERVIHDGESRVALRFPYDTELISVVKGFQGARWSNKMKCWHIADSADAITLLLKAFCKKAYIDYSGLKPNLAERIRTRRIEQQEKNIRTSDIIPAALGEKGEADIAKFRRFGKRPEAVADKAVERVQGQGSSTIGESDPND